MDSVANSTTQIPSILISCNKFNAFCNESGRDSLHLFALFAAEILTNEPDKINCKLKTDNDQA
jgi:hypothetical protein